MKGFNGRVVGIVPGLLAVGIVIGASRARASAPERGAWGQALSQAGAKGVSQLVVPEPGPAAAAREACLSGRRLLVAIEGGGAVELDPASGSVRRAYATGPNAFGALFSKDGRRAFVTDKTAGTLSELDASGAASSVLEVGHEPQQPAVTGAGLLFIPMSGEGAIAVVDASGRPALLGKVTTGEGTKPHIVSLSPDERTLWATVQGADPKVMTFRVERRGLTLVREFRNGLIPRVLAATDRGAFFTAHSSVELHFAGLVSGAASAVYADAQGPFSAPFKQIEGVAVGPRGEVAITHEGRRALVFLRGDGPGRLEKAREVSPLGDNPYWVTWDPSGEAAYVSIPNMGLVEAYQFGDGEGARRLWTSAVGGKPKRMAVAE